MKIGIIAPSPVPFQMGGAERLWASLRRYINESTPHSAEVVKLPVSEANFWSLLDGYERFHNLDVSGFDLVVTGKYPAWMVRHPRHTLYMLHPCRGLYEFYQGPIALTDDETKIGVLKRVWDALDKYRGEASYVEELFAALREVSADADVRNAVAWPGAFARRCIRFLDEIALSPGRICRYTALSKTVARREGYFPRGMNVEVAYPPPPLPGPMRATAGEIGAQARPFIFSASRLDANKRMPLLAEAFSKIAGDIELRIAGVGEDFEKLQMIAERDARIRLLGRVGNEELATLYAQCAFVAFIPYSEDYGLVAIEAFSAGKPLLTCIDSGGPAEINLHEQTGLTVSPDSPTLAAAMRRLLDAPALRATYGDTARFRAADANWPHVAQAVTGEVIPVFGTRKAKRLVVTLSWSFFPPTSGGKVRVYHLYKNLAKWFDIVAVCLIPGSEAYADTEVASGLREIRVPRTAAHDRLDKVAETEAGVPVYDITGALYIDNTPQFREVLERECANADAVIACHPFFAPLLRQVFQGPLWYEAQDVEYAIKAHILPDQFRLRNDFLAFTQSAEQLACAEAEHIWVCSDADGRQLVNLYPVAEGKLRVVGNGTDVESFSFQQASDRYNLRHELLPRSNSTYALFLGSGHGPNIDAVRELFHIASQTPDIVYWIVGNVCYAFDPLCKPSNVWFLGELPETERRVVMELAHVALNPLNSGSGTSLKMLDYMASGLPIVSSTVGVRGLGLVDKQTYFACETADLGDFLTRFDPASESVAQVARNARDWVQANGDWATQVRRLAQELLL